MRTCSANVLRPEVLLTVSHYKYPRISRQKTYSILCDLYHDLPATVHTLTRTTMLFLTTGVSKILAPETQHPCFLHYCGVGFKVSLTPFLADGTVPAPQACTLRF